jgi:hypothetical protein
LVTIADNNRRWFLIRTWWNGPGGERHRRAKKGTFGPDRSVPAGPMLMV